MTDYSEWKILKTEADEKADEYSQVAEWCNNSGQYHIEEQGEYYAVVHNAEPTAAELAEREINELKAYLAATDYVVIKIAEGSATAADYEDVLNARARARTRINELEG